MNDYEFVHYIHINSW